MGDLDPGVDAGSPSSRSRCSPDSTSNSAPGRSGPGRAPPIAKDMIDLRSKAGPAAAVMGSAVLGVSVFLPWYGLTLTDSGVAAAQQGVDQAFQSSNDTNLQGLAGNLKQSFSALAGSSFGTVSAHQALKVISLILLILAAIAFVTALLRLAHGAPFRPSGQVAVVGATAAVFVLFRMVVKPQSIGDYLSVSLSWGAWVALASCVAIVVGALWPPKIARPGREAAGDLSEHRRIQAELVASHLEAHPRRRISDVRVARRRLDKETAAGVRRSAALS